MSLRPPGLQHLWTGGAKAMMPLEMMPRLHMPPPQNEHAHPQRQRRAPAPSPGQLGSFKMATNRRTAAAAACLRAQPRGVGVGVGVGVAAYTGGGPNGGVPTMSRERKIIGCALHNSSWASSARSTISPHRTAARRLNRAKRSSDNEAVTIKCGIGYSHLLARWCECYPASYVSVTFCRVPVI